MTQKQKHFAANMAVLWGAIFIYRTNHFYAGSLNAPGFLNASAPLPFSSQTITSQQAILWLAVLYTLGAAIYYWLKRDPEPSHPYIALTALWRWLKAAARWATGKPPEAKLPAGLISREEKNSILFLLLKFLYLPMMIEFMLANWGSLSGRWWAYSGVLSLPRVVAFNEFFFPCLIDIFFISECALYAFGYAVESRYCKNVVKSVDPTLFGWVVALACYPPFNGFVNNYVSWYTTDDPVFKHAGVTLVAKVLVLVCFFIYLWGAISLGTKCSNLTNRGIVTRGAFARVRHPAYAAKNLAWWIGILPHFSWVAVLSMAFWSLLYFLRAVTEERHLGKDPDYVEYCRQVPYRFIPGVF
jgi:protein-S-isoprenylcysteine O-methyltransferase Ste14